MTWNVFRHYSDDYDSYSHDSYSDDHDSTDDYSMSEYSDDSEHSGEYSMDHDSTYEETREFSHLNSLPVQGKYMYAKNP